MCEERRYHHPCVSVCMIFSSAFYPCEYRASIGQDPASLIKSRLLSFSIQKVFLIKILSVSISLSHPLPIPLSLHFPPSVSVSPLLLPARTAIRTREANGLLTKRARVVCRARTPKVARRRAVSVLQSATTGKSPKANAKGVTASAAPKVRLKSQLLW